jgi:hypothetical protein
MIFSKFTSDDVVFGRTNKVSSGFWADGNYAHSQSQFFTSSTQTAITGSSGVADVRSGLYYYNVYQATPSDLDAQVHFAIAFGDLYGSGSGDMNTSSLVNPTKAIYSAYRNSLLTPTDDSFSFKTGSVSTTTDASYTVTGSSIFVIAFSADKYKDKVDEGQLEFSLSGSNGVFSFIDDSSESDSVQDVYNIVSGSVVDGVPSIYQSGGSINYSAIGLFYPKTGVVILNASAISQSVGVYYNLSNSGNYKLNHRYLYTALVGASQKLMKVRKSEYLPSRQYFIRVKNKEFNYSNNPTFISDGNDGNTKGTIKITDFVNDPHTYPTTVGLYDDNNELVAVAKLSQPTKKTFDTEFTLKIRIDF